jgi:hypothetical protein
MPKAFFIPPAYRYAIFFAGQGVGGWGRLQQMNPEKASGQAVQHETLNAQLSRLQGEDGNTPHLNPLPQVERRGGEPTARRDTYTTGIVPYNPETKSRRSIRRRSSSYGGHDGATGWRNFVPSGARRPPIYVFTKRTHRFFPDFFMEMALNKRLTAEISERNRWVRFGKRTHRKGFSGVGSVKIGFVSGENGAKFGWLRTDE